MFGNHHKRRLNWSCFNKGLISACPFAKADSFTATQAWDLGKFREGGGSTNLLTATYRRTLKETLG